MRLCVSLCVWLWSIIVTSSGIEQKNDMDMIRSTSQGRLADAQQISAGELFNVHLQIHQLHFAGRFLHDLVHHLCWLAMGHQRSGLEIYGNNSWNSWNSMENSTLTMLHGIHGSLTFALGSQAKLKEHSMKYYGTMAIPRLLVTETDPSTHLLISGTISKLLQRWSLRSSRCRKIESNRMWMASPA